MEDGIDQQGHRQATVGFHEESPGSVKLEDVRGYINERMASAQKSLDEANSQVLEVGPGGIPIQPNGVARANERLNYFKTAREMFFSSHGEPNSTWGEAVERAKMVTSWRYEHYRNLYGETDPRDVDDARRKDAQELMGQIKIRDNIMSEFESRYPI